MSEVGVEKFEQRDITERLRGSRPDLVLIAPANDPRRLERIIQPTNIVLTNRETQAKECGRVFPPSMNDVERICAFLEKDISNQKATQYTRDEIEYQLGVVESLVTCVETDSRELVGISIAYPARHLPESVGRLKWWPDNGFSKDLLTDRTFYSELRAVGKKYQGGGVGNILRSVQIMELVNKGYDRIVIYAVPEAIDVNLRFDFENLGPVPVVFGDGTSSVLYLMKLDIGQKQVDKAAETLNKYILKLDAIGNHQ